MPKTNVGSPWEANFRSSIRTTPGLENWTVSNAGGKMQVRFRPSEGKAQAARLPLLWEQGNVNRATLLINRAAKALLEGSTDSLAAAIAIAQSNSTTMRIGVNWEEVAEGLRDVLMNHRNEILAKTWSDNYEPYINEALRLINSGDATDGHTLLKNTLSKWAGKAPSRAACCIALRNLSDHAISRFGAAKSWQITSLDIKELRGKPARKRRKATLSDTELQFLIDGIANRNPRWANVLRILTLFGLRPIELQYLSPNTREDGSLGLWCSYEKTCGGSQTDQRQLEPCWLQDSDGSPIKWTVIEQMHAGLLELPLGNDGEPRKLDGHYVETFLKRQLEWNQLKQICEERGEWLRAYSFRDTFSLRCHRQKIELGAICAAMGHNLEAHARAYRWESQQTTAKAFASAAEPASWQR
ncbi:site-specific integrase [Synechococcus sp. MVIR-18-1]|uniref:site-specific integrase n=1 Tax=Synechococcus sp. MVIR-18-1 TaxID=1386941 RepID=UPI001647EBDF|nr:site-specific integrase [Synechococcus sp. MVIR-18-1]QNI77560.1 phage integrase [Synechococcus sp. MVIR-18-1]